MGSLDGGQDVRIQHIHQTLLEMTKRLTSSTAQDRIQVSEAEAESDGDDEGKATVDNRRPDHALWKGLGGIAKLLGHVHRRVSADERVDAACDADQRRPAQTAPATPVVELGEDLFGGASDWREDPERYEDAKESEDVDHEDDGLDQGQLPCQNLYIMA